MEFRFEWISSEYETNVHSKIYRISMLFQLTIKFVSGIVINNFNFSLYVAQETAHSLDVICVQWIVLFEYRKNYIRLFYLFMVTSVLKAQMYDDSSRNELYTITLAKNHFSIMGYQIYLTCHSNFLDHETNVT